MDSALKNLIREVFLRNGFKIKAGADDLADNVYEAARDLLQVAPAVQGEPVAWSGWGCQYPGKMPRLYGERHIAELNCDWENGDHVLHFTATPQPAEQQPKPISRNLRAVLAMILSALDRDAADGKAVRGEMATELRSALSEQQQQQPSNHWSHDNPGLADQYRAEALAARRSLGFEQDADDVAPADIAAAIESLTRTAPDIPGLTEALRQYQHNDGSGRVFGYDKLLVDRHVAGLVEALEIKAQEDQYPPCDYCGVIPDHHPWHGSGMFSGEDSPHIHACNDCRHLLPTRPAQTDPQPDVAQLVEALHLALEYWRDRQQRYKNRQPKWVVAAESALASHRKGGCK